MHRLWYVRHGANVRGPFPTGAIAQDLILRRVVETDLVSLDGQEWMAVSSIPAFFAKPVHPVVVEPGQANWDAERQNARARWADERGGRDRREASSPAEHEAWLGKRSGNERRQEPEGGQHSHRERARGGSASLRGSWRRLFLVLMAIVLIVALISIVFEPVNPVPVKIVD